MSIQQPTSGTEYPLYPEYPETTVNTVEETITEKRESAGGYRVLAVFSFLLAICGLFIGMLSAALEDFQPGAVFTLFVPGGSDNILDRSVFGLLIAIFKDFGNLGVNLDTMFSSPLGTSLGIWYVLAIILVFVANFGAILSLALMVIALVTKTKQLAKRCAMISAIVTFFSFGGLFLLSFVLGAPAGAAVDLYIAIIAGLAALALMITAIVRNGGRGVLTSLLFLLTVGTAIMLSFPESMTALFAIIAFDLFGETAFLGISLVFFVAMLAFNIFVSTIRLNAKRAFSFDAVRYALQLIALVLTIIAFVANSGKEWDIFTLATSLLIVFTVLAFVIALILAIVKRAKSTKTVEETAILEYPQQPTVIQEVVPPAQPVFVPVMPMTQTIIQQQPPQPQPQPEPKPEAPLTEFERRMQALARGEMPANNAPQQTDLVNDRTNASTAYQKQRPAPASRSSYAYEGSQYMYDPFIKTLTVEEKNEFGDLFIANIYGLHSYLPTYVIGGDNKAFFDRVFIYLGSYRNYISQELLEKIYLFVSKL